MAPSSRGLVFVLTFWVVAWPAASIRTRSPYSGWWGTQEAFALRQAARAPILTGDSAEAERISPRLAELRFTNLRRHRRRGTLRAYQEAMSRSLAEGAGFFDLDLKNARLRSVPK
jgi:hypothetical protein